MTTANTEGSKEPPGKVRRACEGIEAAILDAYACRKCRKRLAAFSVDSCRQNASASKQTIYRWCHLLERLRSPAALALIPDSPDGAAIHLYRALTALIVPLEAGRPETGARQRFLARRPCRCCR